MQILYFLSILPLDLQHFGVHILQVLHLFEEKFPGDTRIRDQIAMLRNDAATVVERESAWDAAEAAAEAAWAAPWASAWAAARAAQEQQLRKMLTEGF